MTRKILVLSMMMLVLSSRGWGQVPTTILEVDIENNVVYGEDVSDLSKFATNPNVTPSVLPRNFPHFVTIGDIVAVNGQPAKGSVTSHARGIALGGEAVADTVRNNINNYVFEILSADGRTTIGSIMLAGVGPNSPPPGAPVTAVSGNEAIVGGTGAFLGARGQASQGPAIISSRQASVAEDPANRRRNGGGKIRFLLSVIPMEAPQVVVNSGFPFVIHSGDSSVVTANNPAAAGETLRLVVTGLGPTTPGVNPGQPFPTSPVTVVNSPVNITVNGESATVLAAVGLPGAVGRYLVDFQVPAHAAKGIATVQVTAAFIQGPVVSIPIQ